MSKSKKLNRDHAKKTQRPMVEDEASARFPTNSIVNTCNYESRKLLSSTGTTRQNTEFAVNVKPLWFVVPATRKSNMDAMTVKHSNVKVTRKLRDTETIMRSLERGGWKSANIS